MTRYAVSILMLICHCATSAQDIAPTTRVRNCLEGGCHASVQEAPFLHGPVAAGACEMCHKYEDPVRHLFVQKNTGADMCDFCHIGKADAAGGKLHQPVADGDCISCHDPHGSLHRMLLRGRTEGESCLACHDSVTNKPHVHSPIVEGNCTNCHRAHSSIYDHLLVAEGKALCLQCHEHVMQPAAAADPPPLYHLPLAEDRPSVLPVHEPVLTEDCTTCHVPHSSDFRGLLTEKSQTLCTSCHGTIAELSLSASVPHLMVSDEEACLHCHAPHASGVQSLLKDWPTALCLECHNEPVQRTDGTIIEAAHDLMQPGAHVHGPVARAECSSCHNVHGAEHADLLTGQYTTSFYQDYDPEAYEFCLRCHDHAIVEEPNSVATNFRNGQRNLHYTHVVEPKNGRSCRVCHATHTSESPRQLRPTVAFGEWEIPIAFEVLENGGSCAAGCHRARTYDRLNPVDYEDSAIRLSPQGDAAARPASGDVSGNAAGAG